jgi:transcriptional regulator with XRE-family HTH domain
MKMLENEAGKIREATENEMTSIEVVKKRESKFYNDPINTKLRFLMDSRKTKTSELAKALGVTVSGVRGWYTGFSRPDLDKIPELCKYFGVTADYLLGLAKGENHEINHESKITGISPCAIKTLIKLNWMKGNWKKMGVDIPGFNAPVKVIEAELSALSFIIENGFSKYNLVATPPEFRHDLKQEVFISGFFKVLYDYIFLLYEGDMSIEAKNIITGDKDQTGKYIIHASRLNQMHFGEVMDCIVKFKEMAENNALAVDEH